MATSNLNNLKFPLQSVSVWRFITVSLCFCMRQRENFKITLSCLFGGFNGDDEVWVHPLQLCVHTHTFSVHSQSIYACPPCSPSVIPDFSLWWQPSLCSTTSVSQECHFSFLLGLYGFKGTHFHSFPVFFFFFVTPRLTASLFFTLLLNLPHSSHHYLSRQNLLKLQMCRGKKNKMGRALIPGIWDSPFRPG